MIAEIKQLNSPTKIKTLLTVPLIAGYLSYNYSVADISRVTNQSTSWICQFIKKNYDDLLPLIDNRDVYAAIQSKYIAQKAKDKIEDIINATNDFNKKDLIPLTAVSDRHTQQYRLLSDKSTNNVNVNQVNSTIQELSARETELLASLKDAN